LAVVREAAAVGGAAEEGSVIDQSKLTPAPWSVEHFDQWSQISHGPLDDASERFAVDDPMSFADMEFCALARNAFDVMMRRSDWIVSACIAGDYSQWWKVEDDNDRTVGEPQTDPFTALVEADRWYRENVETKMT